MGIAIIVDWYGPFASKIILKDDMKENAQGKKVLYMGLKRNNIVNYVGLTSDPASRLNNHEKMAHPDNVKFFWGEIVSQGVGGKRSTKCKTDLKEAEKAIISYLAPNQNDKLKHETPKDCVVVYSRFFDKDDWQKPTNPLPKFPKIIAYNSWSEEWVQA